MISMPRCVTCVDLKQGWRRLFTENCGRVSARWLKSWPAFSPIQLCWEEGPTITQTGNGILKQELWSPGQHRIVIQTILKETVWTKKSMVTAWQKRQTQPHGKSAFSLPHRHCRTSVTKTLLKGEEMNKTLEEPFTSTWIKVKCRQKGKLLASKQHWVRPSPFLSTLLDSQARFWLRAQRPQKDPGSLSGGPRWEGHFLKYK